ncbi:MAG TPA: hypothetical protein VF172_06520 [Nitrososphaera sp.]
MPQPAGGSAAIGACKTERISTIDGTAVDVIKTFKVARVDIRFVAAMTSLSTITT